MSKHINLLEKAGLTIEQTSDFSMIQKLIEKLGKPYLTPQLDMCVNDFTTANCFWVVVRRAGEVSALGGARLDDLTDTDVAGFMYRHFARHYEGGLLSVADPVLRALYGRVAYVGDLYVSPTERGSLKLLSSAMIVCHMTISLKWNPNCTYAFLRKSDVDRGAASRYGFTRVIPFSKEFSIPVPPRSNDECFAVLNREDLNYLIKAEQNN